MGLVRAFLAAELPATLQDAIEKATAGLREILGSQLVRWVPARNIHLTLKFLGEVPSSNLDLIKPMLAAEAAHYQAFEGRIEGIGSYPTPQRPRVLWVGLKAPAVLGSLQHAVEIGAARLGYRSEERGFSPHLTIGRVRQNASAADLQRICRALEQAKVGDLGSARLDAIHLFKSDLQSTGSVYTKLFSAALGNG